jgi:demethylmenaquinone methyltransferase/2-methoxy-6-polyprenyl-1,4-benzoquinol methylase
MASRLRERLFDPERTLEGAGVRAGDTVLEVGCGTGFFTIPAARRIGPGGTLIALDLMTSYLERVTGKVEAAGLTNVRVLRRDALDTGLDSASVDQALLFGVLPFPSLPLGPLLAEMHRILVPGGRLSVWMFPVSFGVPKRIGRSELFSPLDERNGVHNYRRASPRQ